MDAPDKKKQEGSGYGYNYGGNYAGYSAVGYGYGDGGVPEVRSNVVSRTIY